MRATRGAARRAGPGCRLRVLPQQADHDGRGRRRDDARRRRPGGCSRAFATRGAPTVAAGSTTRGSASTTASTTSGPRSGSASSRSSTGILAGARARSPRATASLLAGIDGLELPCPDDDEHERSWFVYVVAAPGRRRPGARDRAARRAGDPDGALPAVHPSADATCASDTAFAEGLCPVAEAASRRTLALPFHARLDEDDQAYVAAPHAALGISAEA